MTPSSAECHDEDDENELRCSNYNRKSKLNVCALQKNVYLLFLSLRSSSFSFPSFSFQSPGFDEVTSEMWNQISVVIIMQSDFYVEQVDTQPQHFNLSDVTDKSINVHVMICGSDSKSIVSLHYFPIVCVIRYLVFWASLSVHR